MNNNKDFTIRDLSTKLKSKAEFYICWKGRQHLFPPKQHSTQKFLRNKLLGTKLYVKWDDVTVIKVPQYKGLFVRDLLKFAATKSISRDMYLTINTPKSRTESGSVTC